MKDDYERKMNMIDLGIKEQDFHTEWYLTRRRNQLLNDLANTLGDVEMYMIARELRQVVKELMIIKKQRTLFSSLR